MYSFLLKKKFLLECNVHVKTCTITDSWKNDLQIDASKGNTIWMNVIRIQLLCSFFSTKKTIIWTSNKHFVWPAFVIGINEVLQYVHF